MPNSQERADVLNQPVLTAAELALRQIEMAIGQVTAPLGQPAKQPRMTLEEIKALSKGG